MTSPIINLLLESLSSDDLNRMFAASEAIALPLRMTLYSASVRPKYAYFVTSGIASIVFNARAGQVAEVGIIGCEGMTGAVHLLGNLPVPTECFMQIAGSGRRMPLGDMERFFVESPSLHAKVLEFIQFTYLNAAVLAACNALHTVQQRLARWLLIVQDRMPGEGYALTHEFLAEMLVVQRPTLSIVAASLQREGTIHYRHGQLRILDREKLEANACECYAIAHELLGKLYSSSHMPPVKIELPLHPILI